MPQVPLKTVHEVLSADVGDLTQIQKGIREAIEGIYGDDTPKLAFYAKLSVELGKDGDVMGSIKI